MKNIFYVLSIVLILFIACKKQDLEPETGAIEKVLMKDRYSRVPPITWIPQPVNRCIYSYQDLIDVLATNRVAAQSVILSNGVTIEPGTDLKSVTYEAEPGNNPNSLFGSRLTVEWRWPGGDWQLNTSDTWSLGCVYKETGQPHYTNLIKGGDTIQINSCFFWVTDLYTGERIDYLVIE